MPRTDDRTEKPTAKRKRKARSDGQVAKTPELSGWLSILAVTVLLPGALRSDGSRVTGLFVQATHVMAAPTSAGALAVMEAGLSQAFDIVLPLAGLMLALGVVANVAQVGFLFSRKALTLQWSRLSPLQGIRRLFSPNTLWQLVKEILKLAVVGLLSYQFITAMIHRLIGPQPAGLGAVVAFTGSELLALVREVALAGILIAVGDYAFQRRRMGKQLKMTKQEVKDEHRQSEGAPEAKRAIRQKQRTLSRMRMMAAVAGADVVVANPTHFAVALRYEPSRGQAPRVVAKGADEVARRIREEAQRHHVPVVEDPPLARALFAACELEAMVPHELYVAVARLLAFVLTLPATVRAAGVVHRRPSTTLVA